MRLWPEEFEALRPEARQAVEAGIGALRGYVGQDAPLPVEPAKRARALRHLAASQRIVSPRGTDREIAGVRCRVFAPRGKPSAVYLHFHGGGMVTGAPEMMDLPNAQLCDRFGLTVVSVDYRLAPEHPYPAGPDDGMAVAAWLLQHAGADLGSDRLVIGGESAGAYMAAAVLLRMRDELNATGSVVGVNLVFGVFDHGRSPSQRGVRAQQGPDLLDPEQIQFFGDCYLPGRTDEERRDPAVSPAFADLHGLPPALMSVGGSDHLLDDTLMLASRWVAAGSPAELFVAPDMPHGFMAFPCALTRHWARVTNRWFAELTGTERTR